MWASNRGVGFMCSHDSLDGLFIEERVSHVAIACVAIMSDSGVSCGFSKTADVLTGKPSRFVLENNLASFPEFGRLSFLSSRATVHILTALKDAGLIEQVELSERGGRPVLRATTDGRLLLAGKRTFGAPLPWSLDKTELPDCDADLHERLRILRLKLAHEEGVDPYRILTDRELFATAVQEPTAMETLADIKGWGAVRLCAYGQRFIDEVKAFQTSRDRSPASATLVQAKGASKAARLGEGKQPGPPTWTGSSAANRQFSADMRQKVVQYDDWEPPGGSYGQRKGSPAG